MAAGHSEVQDVTLQHRNGLSWASGGSSSSCPVLWGVLGPSPWPSVPVLRLRDWVCCGGPSFILKNIAISYT